jgi:hypothetical protein
VRVAKLKSGEVKVTLGTKRVSFARDFWFCCCCGLDCVKISRGWRGCLGLVNIVRRVGVWTSDVTFISLLLFFCWVASKGASFTYPLLNRYRVHADSESNTGNNFAVDRPRFIFTYLFIFTDTE